MVKEKSIEGKDDTQEGSSDSRRSKITHDNGDNEKVEDSIDTDRPIVCILEDPPFDSSRKDLKHPRYRMFRVVRSKGKQLASGGFGVTIAENLPGKPEIREHHDATIQECDKLVVDDKNTSLTKEYNEFDADDKLSSYVNDDNFDEQTTNIQSSMTKPSSKSAEYLFIEEALFLHEKGLLQAMVPSKVADNALDATNETSPRGTGNDNNEKALTALDTSQLYQLLPTLGISLAIYRVYSHLRSQDFRVLRHDPNRYDLLCLQKEELEKRRQRIIDKQAQQEETESSQNENTTPKKDDGVILDSSEPHRKGNLRKEFLRLRRKVRESIKNAIPPSIPHPNQSRNIGSGDSNDDSNAETIRICWDAYNPNSNFGKTHPGFPDFYVTATYYNLPLVLFSDLKNLIRDKCNGIPLKVATVSDSGT